MRGLIVVVGCVCLFLAGAAQALNVDDFTQGPATLTYPGPLSSGISQSQHDLDPDHTIGGGRFLQIGVASSSDAVIETAATLAIDPDATDGRFQFRSAIPSEGSALSYVTLRYPAPHEHHGGIPLGLDATQHGNAFRLHNVRSNRGDPFPYISFGLFINAEGSSSGATLPVLNRDDPYDLIIPFWVFGSSADFTQVDRLIVSGLRLQPRFEFSFDAISIVDVLRGDANLDGQVDIGDLSVLAANWQQPGSWASGDFNGDGIVNLGDLSILAGNWQAEAAGMSLAEAMATFDAFEGVVIPEPAALGLVAVSLLVLRRRGRRH